MFGLLAINLLSTTYLYSWAGPLTILSRKNQPADESSWWSLIETDAFSLLTDPPRERFTDVMRLPGLSSPCSAHVTFPDVSCTTSAMVQTFTCSTSNPTPPSPPPPLGVPFHFPSSSPTVLQHNTIAISYSQLYSWTFEGFWKDDKRVFIIKCNTFCHKLDFEDSGFAPDHSPHLVHSTSTQS